MAKNGPATIVAGAALKGLNLETARNQLPITHDTFRRK